MVHDFASGSCLQCLTLFWLAAAFNQSKWRHRIRLRDQLIGNYFFFFWMWCPRMAIVVAGKSGSGVMLQRKKLLKSLKTQLFVILENIRSLSNRKCWVLLEKLWKWFVVIAFFIFANFSVDFRSSFLSANECVSLPWAGKWKFLKDIAKFVVEERTEN